MTSRSEQIATAVQHTQAQMTCFSCEEARIGRCAKNLPLWPSGGPGWCDDFSYSPGTSPQEFEPGEYERVAQKSADSR